ncbi:MAG: DUF5678 domain-containing protein [Vicinamibacteria bacterium]
MNLRDFRKIDLSKLGDLHRYVGQWIAISARNEIVSHSRTYTETVKGVENPREMVLFKVPRAGMLAVTPLLS